MTFRIAACFSALMASVGAMPPAMAQIPGGPAGYPSGHRFPVAQAEYYGPAQRTQVSGTMVDAYGQPAVLPVQYCDGCPPMGGAGYGCDPYGDCMPDAFGGASLNTDQCGPHYFDFSAEWIYLRRNKLGDRDIDFTSANIGGPIILSTGPTDPPPPGFLVTGGIDDGYESGFRLTGRLDVGALSVVELSYTGYFGLESEAQAIDLNPVSPTEGNLFSLFSEFGLNPAGGIGMPETERAVLQRIAFESELQTAELSFRRYWVGYSPRISGTLLAGFRYTQLRESLAFHTEADGTFDLVTLADNNLAGFQCGGDIWYTVLQGLRIGTESKVGIYNNNYDVKNRGVSSDGTPSVDELFDNNQVAFIGETRFDLVADILPSWSVKVGYEILWISSVALAIDNFPTGSPYPNLGPQVPPFVDDQGDALYHGFHAGMEYIW